MNQSITVIQNRDREKDLVENHKMYLIYTNKLVNVRTSGHLSFNNF